MNVLRKILGQKFNCCDQVINSFISDSPQFVGPGGDTQRVVLERGNTTLVCASRVNGNPTPTISWMDNNGSTVSDRTGISGSTTLSLTVSGVTRYQAGNWTCTVQNSPGGTPCSVQRQIMLMIIGEYVLIILYIQRVLLILGNHSTSDSGCYQVVLVESIAVATNLYVNGYI